MGHPKTERVKWIQNAIRRKEEEENDIGYRYWVFLGIPSKNMGELLDFGNDLEKLKQKYPDAKIWVKN